MELRRQNTRSELIIRSQEEVFVIGAELEIGALEPVDILGFHTGHWLEVLCACSWPSRTKCLLRS